MKVHSSEGTCHWVSKNNKLSVVGCELDVEKVGCELDVECELSVVKHKLWLKFKGAFTLFLYASCVWENVC